MYVSNSEVVFWGGCATGGWFRFHVWSWRDGICRQIAVKLSYLHLAGSSACNVYTDAVETSIMEGVMLNAQRFTRLSRWTANTMLDAWCLYTWYEWRQMGPLVISVQPLAEFSPLSQRWH